MFRRRSVAVALAGSAFLLAACGGRSAPEKGKPAAASAPAEVTLHVDGMTERQGLT
jgi:ABC-type glycerol-3-phosphate transport system substrate-binding protein